MNMEYRRQQPAPDRDHAWADHVLGFSPVQKKKKWERISLIYTVSQWRLQDNSILWRGKYWNSWKHPVTIRDQSKLYAAHRVGLDNSPGLFGALATTVNRQKAKNIRERNTVRGPTACDTKVRMDEEGSLIKKKATTRSTGYLYINTGHRTRWSGHIIIRHIGDYRGARV